MNLFEMAMALVKKPDKGSVNDNFSPVSHTSKSAEILSEMESRKGFTRSSPSMEYKGSKANFVFVRERILERWGQEEADLYQPCVQVKPITEWLKLGYSPKEGEKALCQIPTVRNRHMIDCDMWHILQMQKD